MSLELALEKAFVAVTRANEAALSQITFYCASQTAANDPDFPIQPALEKLELPSITITVQPHQETPPNSGVYEVELVVEARDAVVRNDGPPIRLDELYKHATRPFLYKPLSAMLNGAGARYGMQVFGQPQRGESGQIIFGEGMVSRSMTALFICSCTI